VGQAGTARSRAHRAATARAASAAARTETVEGMLLHINGSTHRWFNEGRWYDRILILDDTTNEIYYSKNGS
jgi:hypothetical protein